MTVSVLCWPIGQPTECHSKKCLFSWNNVVGCMTFVAVTDMPAELMNVCYVYSNPSGFLIMHPDLVCMTLLSCDSVLLLLGMFVSSCLCLLFATVVFCSISIVSLSWMMFVWLLCCALWLFVLLVYAMTYTHGLLLILFCMSANGSVQVWDCFVVLYCRYVAAVIDVGLMCHLLHIVHLPLVVSCMV